LLLLPQVGDPRKDREHGRNEKRRQPQLPPLRTLLRHHSRSGAKLRTSDAQLRTI